MENSSPFQEFEAFITGISTARRLRDGFLEIAASDTASEDGRHEKLVVM